MSKLINLSAEKAKAHFMKGSSYFNGDLPDYISFEPILKDISVALGDRDFPSIKCADPADFPDVNYNFVANKDGRFAWRPYELMHPVLYVCLVNLICDEGNWKIIQSRFKDFEGGVVSCCSAPVMSVDHQSDTAAQISSLWQRVEQKSL